MKRQNIQWTVVAMLAVAGVPAAAAAQRPTADSAKQGTATGRRVNETNEAGDTTRSALRDSVLRNSTNTNTAPTQTGASTTSGAGASSAAAREGRATGGQAGLADSVRSMQAATPGRPVPQTNEGGDTTQSALRDSVLRNATRTPGTNVSPSTDAAGGAAAAGRSSRGGGMSLTREQTRQLQQALNDAGCDAGTPDGMMGRKTRTAMTCARQKKGISGTDNQALFQALGLSF
jgi:hypothetical protein